MLFRIRQINMLLSKRVMIIQDNSIVNPYQEVAPHKEESIAD